MKQPRDARHIIREFKVRQSRQFFAIGLTLFILLFLTLLYTRNDIFGVFTKNVVFALQIIVIVAFVWFSSVNWRCPSCGKYLGSDINRRACKRCGTRLK